MGSWCFRHSVRTHAGLCFSFNGSREVLELCLVTGGEVEGMGGGVERVRPVGDGLTLLVDVTLARLCLG